MRSYSIAGEFDLTLTAAPVAWGKGRWPNVDWIDGRMYWVGWEDPQLVRRIIEQVPGSNEVLIDSTGTDEGDRRWLDDVLGAAERMPSFSDPVIASLASSMPGLRPFANGSLFEGVIGSIVGQSITVAAAATTERRLAALVHDGVEIEGRRFYPSPRAEDLARLTSAEVRSTGVTWRRAEAIVAIAQLAMQNAFPRWDGSRNCDASLRAELRALPLVGPWTAESAMLWGAGMSDIHPSGDVALLRAARASYDRPDMSMKELDELSEGWSPGRSWAARLLWTQLLGRAPCPRGQL